MPLQRKQQNFANPAVNEGEMHQKFIKPNKTFL
jgi:hypothetical protein